MSALLLDIGNSRLKWALLDGDRLAPAQAVEHAGAPQQALAQLAIPPPAAVWISHVVGSEGEEQLAAAIERRWNLQPRFARTQARCDGLIVGYSEPERLGVDRWLAMLTAWQRCRTANIVVDAGTALTADVVDAGGQHLGGLIAPGLLTAQRGVLGATRFATRDIHAVPHTGLGRDTEACVRQGAMLGCLGAIDRAAAQLPGATGFITGGDAATLLSGLDARWQHRADLVLEGLLAWSRMAA